MKTILILLATTRLAVAAPHASRRYLSAREEWSAAVASRFESARHAKLQRTTEPDHFRSDTSLARAMGVRPHALNAWINRAGGFSLDDGLKAAAYLEVQAWWLLGYDILQRAYWSKLSRPNLAASKPTGFTHPRFGEMLLAARHFDPRDCADRLELTPALEAPVDDGTPDVPEIR